MSYLTTTDNWDALMTTTWRNQSKLIPDAISKNKKFYYMIKKSGGWQAARSGGVDVILPIRYANKTSQVLGAYDEVDTTPIDGATVSRWTYAIAGSSITISDHEVWQNNGEHQIIDLVTLKTSQTVDGITEDFNRRTLAGNGENVTTQIATAYNENGNSFVEPLPKIVAKSPSTGTVGGLDPASRTWWRNRTADCVDTSFATQLNSLELLRLECSKGVGGLPDFHLVDQNVYVWYPKALRSFHQNPSYRETDIPFEHFYYHGGVLTWDEDMPEWDAGDNVLDTAKGTWLMLNTKFIKVIYDPNANFEPGPFVRPHNQFVKTALVAWRGAVCTSNRAKHGVLYGIDTTVAA